MRIDKIKTSGDAVYIEWSEKDPTGITTHTLDCKHRALPEFYLKRNALADPVLDLLELPSKYGEGLEVRSVSFDFTDEGKTSIMGAVITAVKRLKTKKCIVLNTPHATDLPIGENSELAACLTTECVTILRAWQSEAARYIRGERAQLDLFKKADKPKKEEHVAAG